MSSLCWSEESSSCWLDTLLQSQDRVSAVGLGLIVIFIPSPPSRKAAPPLSLVPLRRRRRIRCTLTYRRTIIRQAVCGVSQTVGEAGIARDVADCLLDAQVLQKH